MLTTVPAPHRAIRRWTSGRGLVSSRWITSSGLRGSTGFFPKYRHEKNSGMGSRISKHAGAKTNECHKSSLR
jgi:hypothetical protein